MDELERTFIKRWLEMLEIFQTYETKIAKAYLLFKDSIGIADLQMAVVELKEDKKYLPDLVKIYAPSEAYVGKVMSFIVQSSSGKVLFTFDGEKKYMTGPDTKACHIIQGKILNEETKSPEELTEEYIEQKIRQMLEL